VDFLVHLSASQLSPSLHSLDFHSLDDSSIPRLHSIILFTLSTTVLGDSTSSSSRFIRLFVYFARLLLATRLTPPPPPSHTSSTSSRDHFLIFGSPYVGFPRYLHRKLTLMSWW
jgi:hypothetical protein